MASSVLQLLFEIVAPIACGIYLAGVSTAGSWRRLWFHTVVSACLLASLAWILPRITYDDRDWMGPALQFYPIGVVSAAVAITLAMRFGATRWIRVTVSALAAWAFGFGTRWYA